MSEYRMPPPAYAPLPDSSLKNEGADIAYLASWLGKPLMPWQRFVADIATEYHPDGRYRFHTVLVTVPRQSGKTTLCLPVQMYRVMRYPRSKGFFTAQTGKDARSRFEDAVELIEDSPLEELVATRRAAGSQRFMLPNRSSFYNLFAPGPKAMHGETPLIVTLDEIWVHDEVRGGELMGAIGPAQIRVPERQLWMVSTMGTSQSHFMNDLVERGRAGESGLAYFEWSMPDGMDPYSPDTWAAFHPAVGAGITVADLAAECGRYSSKPGEWMRGFMNRLTQAVNPLITEEDLAQLQNLNQAEYPAWSQVTISYEVAYGSTCAAVVASWRDSVGAPCSALVHAAPGTAWLVPFLRMLARENPAAIAADDGGSTRRITDQLTAGIIDQDTGEVIEPPLEVTTLGVRDFALACDSWLTWARDEKTLRLDTSQSFPAAIAAAVLRPKAGVSAPSREHSTGPIPSLIASAVGLYVHDHRDRPAGKPLTQW